MWKHSLKNVESDNNKILYETLLDFFKANGTYFLNKPRTYFLACLITYLFTYLLTYFMELRSSWEANRFSASQEISRIFWYPKVHYCD